VKRKVVVAFKFVNTPNIFTLSYEEEDDSINDAKAINNALLELGFYGDRDNIAVLCSVSLYRQEGHGKTL
jgi:hypothetical protein